MSTFGTRTALFMLITAVSLLPMLAPNGADHRESLQRLEILPNTHMPIELIDYDSTGDMLFLTISPTAIEGKQVRNIDVYIMDETNAKNFAMVKKADPKSSSMYYAFNLSSRYEREYKCLDDIQAYLVLDNPIRSASDDYDLYNSTATYRVDYRVEDAASEASIPWGLIIMALLALAIAGALIAGIVLYRRSKRERKSFFVKGSFLYYALQGPDGNVFYFGPDQYNRMYEAGSLAGFQFLGYTREIGGEIYNESGMVVSQMTAAPAAAYPADAVAAPAPILPQPVILQAPAPVETGQTDTAPVQDVAPAPLPVQAQPPPEGNASGPTQA
jgi:hypothetical protein